MKLSEEIDAIKSTLAKKALSYSIAATFGRSTSDQLNSLLEIRSLLNVLERNDKRYRNVKIKADVKNVSLSSLKVKNNTLFLESNTTYKCSVVEVRPCLDDEAICKIVERVEYLSSIC